MLCALHIYYCCVRHITTAFSAGSRSLYHKGCVMHVQVTFLSLFSNVGQRHSNVFVFGVILGLFDDVFNCVCQWQIAVGWLGVRNEEERENRLPWSVLSRYPGIRFEPQQAINFRRASLRTEYRNLDHLDTDVTSWTRLAVFCRFTSRYSDSLHDGRSGDRIPMGGEIFAPLQTGPECTQPPT